MALTFWNFWSNKLFNWLATFTNSPYWKTKLAVFTVLYILFTSFPDYQALVKMDTGGQRLAARFEVIDWIGTHPFQNLPEHLFTGKVLSEGDQSHFKKRVFRPLIPVALHTVGLKAKHYVGIQFVVGILFVVLLIRFLSTHLSSTASVLATFMFANLFVTKWTFFDFFYHDPLGYLLLLVIVNFRNPLLIVLGIVLGGFVDERAVIGSSAAVLWWFWQESNAQKVALSNVFSFKRYRATWAAVVGILLFIVLRLYVMSSLGMRTDKSMLGFDANQYNSFPMGLTVTYECAWLLLIGAVVGMVTKKDWLYLLMFMFSALGVIAAGSLVLDFSRSYAYGYVSLLFAIVYLSKTETLPHFLNGLTFCAIGCFLFPTYYQIGSSLFWMPHIFPKIKVLLAFYHLI